MWNSCLSSLVEKKTHTHTQTHTLGTGAGYCDLCVCMRFFSRRGFLCLCASCVPGQRLMRYEWILPSSVVFLGVTVKVNLSTRERVHGWWRQGHVSPTCPIWFRGLCSTFHLLFLPNLCTWGKVKREGSLVFSTILRNPCTLYTQILFYTEFTLWNTHTQHCLESYLLSFSAIWTFSIPSPTQCSLFVFFVCWQHIRTLSKCWHFLKRHQNLRRTTLSCFHTASALALLYLVSLTFSWAHGLLCKSTDRNASMTSPNVYTLHK